MSAVAEPIQWNLTANKLISLALEEDLGHGDLTTQAVLNGRSPSVHAQITAKEELVIAGLIVSEQVFRQTGEILFPNGLEPDHDLHIEKHVSDGDRVKPDETVVTIEGPVAVVLAAERTALNFLQRLSGVATVTRRLVQSIESFPAVIVDTRKTTPGWRTLEKAAVRVAGGHNHRLGLDDGILIKENHIAIAGGIGAAIRQARKIAHHLVRIEIEVTSLGQLRKAIEHNADVILLDNMTVHQMKEAVRIADGAVPLEASGGIDEETIVSVAETGVDLISVGALTHSAPAVDLSLVLDLRE